VKDSPIRWQSAEPAKKAGVATSSAATKDKALFYTALRGKETSATSKRQPRVAFEMSIRDIADTSNHYISALDRYNSGMQRKIFWTVFVLLGLLADLILPFWWACAATIPLLFVAWWVAYRSDWF